MPFIHHTPESLLPRSDSKNPATTCKGITANGRPCRRSLAASPRNSPTPSPNIRQGVVAVLEDIGTSHEGAAAFFCWQHKEQAEALATSTNANKTKIVELKERSSIETLIDRLGVIEIEEKPRRKKKQKPQPGEEILRRDTLPQQWQNVSGPLMAVPEDPFTTVAPTSRPRPQRHQPKRHDSTFIFSFFCCMQSSDVEETEAIRVRSLTSRPEKAPEMVYVHPRQVSRIPHAKPILTPQKRPAPRRNQSPSYLLPSNSTLQPFTNHHVNSALPRPSLPRDPSSRTAHLLALIPHTLSPQTTSLLLAELAKPLTPTDREAGYIYIFQLIPATSSPPPASALLSDPPSYTSRRPSGISDIIALKIGRAANVQRRLNQWSRQCGQDVALVRYYPLPHATPLHVPSLGPPSASSSQHQPPSPSPAAPPRKVPCAGRVERLVHLELAERRVRKECEGCGREHREWFEVEGTREGVRGVDEVVRRWVGWGERNTKVKGDGCSFGRV